jgi:hypothetical protein
MVMIQRLRKQNQPWEYHSYDTIVQEKRNQRHDLLDKIQPSVNHPFCVSRALLV